MRRKLYSIVINIMIVLVCNIINIYTTINNSIDKYELQLLFIVIILGIISQVATAKLLLINMSNKILSKVWIITVMISQFLVWITCIFTDNKSVGNILVMTFSFIIIVMSIRKMTSFFKPKKRDYKRSIRYIKENYPNAVIHKEDEGFKGYNGEYVKFFIGEKKKRQRYYIFIDVDGNLTDTYKEINKSKENMVV